MTKTKTVSKTAISMAAIEKTHRKPRAARAASPIASDADAALAATPTKLDASPAKPVLELTTPVEQCYIYLKLPDGNIGQAVSDASGQIPIAKRLALALTELSGCSVAENPFIAFEITDYSTTNTPEIHAQLKPGAPIMRLPTSDAKFVESTRRTQNPATLSSSTLSGPPRTKRSPYSGDALNPQRKGFLQY